MIIALFPKIQRKEGKSLAQQIIAFLRENHVSVVVEDDQAVALNAPPLSSVQPKEVQFFITMGGDGSILRVAHRYVHFEAAILGINLGQLGFMADVQISEVLSSLEDFLSGAYTIEKRMVLEGMSDHQHSFFAINDCVLHRACNPNLIEISIFIDNLFFNTFEADGMILATPNGSTAYSLAAGGPIICPNVDALILTPICPHTISNRPIVISTKHTIRIQYISKNAPVEFVSDGFQHFTMHAGDVVQIRKSLRTFNLVTLTRSDYFSILRNKLNWSGKLR